MGGGALYLHIVRIEGGIKNLNDGSNFQPPPRHLNNERSLSTSSDTTSLFETL